MKYIVTVKEATDYEVEASSEREAIEEMLRAMDNGGSEYLKCGSGPTTYSATEWHK